MRGEGAILYDAAGATGDGRRPPARGPRAARRRRRGDQPADGRGAGGVDDHVFLDATHMGERFYERFPSITEACREIGIDPARDRIPVAPAAHYACGGVPARLDGTTALAGFYAVGEVACTGVHGANRLASNSLTESVVAGTRLGRDLAWELPDARRAGRATSAAGRRPRPAPAGARCAPRCRATSAWCATPRRSPRPPVRSAPSPARSTRRRRRRGRRGRGRTCSRSAAAVVAAAEARTESRGCHRRADYPEPATAWLTHLDVRRSTCRTASAVVEVRPDVRASTRCPTTTATASSSAGSIPTPSPPSCAWRSTRT